MENTTRLLRFVAVFLQLAQKDAPIIMKEMAILNILSQAANQEELFNI